MVQKTDEMIVEAVTSGDLEAFGELINRYEAKIIRYGRRFLGSLDDIEDVVQETFIKAYTNIQSFDTSKRFSPWLYRIAHNTFVNELRRQKRKPLLSFDFDTMLPFLVAKETADEDSLTSEIKNDLDSLLEKLPDLYREVVILSYYDELSYQEISDVLKIPVTSVGVRLGRARKKLKDLYQTKYGQNS